MWNLKNKQVNITKRNRLTNIENKLVVTSGEWEGRKGKDRGRGLKDINYYV